MILKNEVTKEILDFLNKAGIRSYCGSNCDKCNSYNTYVIRLSDKKYIVLLKAHFGTLYEYYLFKHKDGKMSIEEFDTESNNEYNSNVEEDYEDIL